MPGLDQVSKMQDLTPLPLSGRAYLQARYSCRTSECHGTGFGGQEGIRVMGLYLRVRRC